MAVWSPNATDAVYNVLTVLCIQLLLHFATHAVLGILYTQQCTKATNTILFTTVSLWGQFYIQIKNLKAKSQ